MFQLLEDSGQIAKAQKKFEATIRQRFRRQLTRDIGHPGGAALGATIHTDGAYWFRTDDLKGAQRPNPRRLNWFGVFHEKDLLEISVEINVPYEGRNNQVAGFFAKDSESGSIYLFHSGRVGGGKAGVGKFSFLAWSSEDLHEVLDSEGSIRHGLLVMPIEAKGAIRPLIRYLDLVVRFKKAVRNDEVQSPEVKERQKKLEDYYSEPRGRRKGKRSPEFDYVSRHGDVVDSLAEWLKIRPLAKGCRLVKDVLIDLGVENNNGLCEVYEVKSSASRTNLYCAIGQVLVHGISSDCKRVLVIPEEEQTPSDVKKSLERLGIEVIRFKLHENSVEILDGTLIGPLTF